MLDMKNEKKYSKVKLLWTKATKKKNWGISAVATNGQASPDVAGRPWKVST